MTENTHVIKNETLSKALFEQLAGKMGDTYFVKTIYDRELKEVHYINDKDYQFHADYIGEVCLNTPKAVIRQDIDSFNYNQYKSPTRRFYIGIITFQNHNKDKFFTFETVEVDTMDEGMVVEFYTKLRAQIERQYPLFFKPSTHQQEAMISKLPIQELPRILNHELLSDKKYVPLNDGGAKGRLRCFATKEQYKEKRDTLEWYDILLMPRVPDSIPRIAGIINSHKTTPLSHTNVLAHGWGIPNAIQIGSLEEFSSLDGAWVNYVVSSDNLNIELSAIGKPEEIDSPPDWQRHFIKLETPDSTTTPIRPLDRLRLTDSFIYGTKAAHLGELHHIQRNGSPKMLGFYSVPRGHRPNFIPYLERYFEAKGRNRVQQQVDAFIRDNFHVPRGISLPFSIHLKFLQSSPTIQQLIGKLKMALELKSSQVDSLCLRLQKAIKQAKIPQALRDQIDNQLALNLAGAESLVVRSSSNAEDLEGFSAAGIYESINHVTKTENVFNSIKKVYASLLHPRCVHLLEEVGISLDDCFMGVIIQEEVPCAIGGVMVTNNPIKSSSDLFSVYINVGKDANSVVDNSALPRQYLYNTLEGQGKTISLGDYQEDLDLPQKALLEKLAMGGRFLQSHFSTNYTFDKPLDIEWAIAKNKLYLLQIRPYGE